MVPPVPISAFPYVLCGLLLTKHLFFPCSVWTVTDKTAVFPWSISPVNHQTVVFPMFCVVCYSSNSCFSHGLCGLVFTKQFFLSPCVQCKGLRYFVLKLQKCSKTQHTIEAEIFFMEYLDSQISRKAEIIPLISLIL